MSELTVDQNFMPIESKVSNFMFTLESGILLISVVVLYKTANNEHYLVVVRVLRRPN